MEGKESRVAGSSTMYVRCMFDCCLLNVDVEVERGVLFGRVGWNPVVKYIDLDSNVNVERK